MPPQAANASRQFGYTNSSKGTCRSRSNRVTAGPGRPSAHRGRAFPPPVAVPHGGHPRSRDNLWSQRWDGERDARVEDRLQRRLQVMVWAGEMSLHTYAGRCRVTGMLLIGGTFHQCGTRGTLANFNAQLPQFQAWSRLRSFRTQGTGYSRSGQRKCERGAAPIAVSQRATALPCLLCTTAPETTSYESATSSCGPVKEPV